MTGAPPEEFWLPALKPVRTPALVRLGMRVQPCIYWERHLTRVFLALPAPAGAQTVRRKFVTVATLLPL
jgi:hypothetical protein